MLKIDTMARKRRSAQERARLVTAFRASDLTQRQFAERKGITVSALQSWLYKPNGQQQHAKASAPSFVRVVEAQAPGGAVVVSVGDAITVTFAVSPEPNYLAVLVRALAC